MRGTQPLPRVGPSALTAEPLTEQQVDAGEMDGDPDALEALDCFAVERLGGVATAQQCLRAG